MKKDPIDSLFEEKLKDYGEQPDEKVWKSIEHSLDQKKKQRRVLPIWWKLGGAAAVLAVLFYLLGPAEQGIEPGEDPITNTEETRPASPEIDSAPGQAITPPSGPVDSDVSSVNKPTGQEPEGNDLQSEEVRPQPNTGISGVENQIADEEARQEDASGNVPKSEVADVQPNNTREQGLTNDPDNTTGNPDTRIAVNRPDEDNRPGLNPDAAPKDATAPGKGILKQPGKEQIAETEKEDELSEGKSIFDAIAENEAEDEILAENSSQRWSVGPKVAPVYFNSFGEGSPIHSNFIANSKSGNVNFSYGLSLSYAITPKLSVRSGIHKVDYGYDTNDITFSPTLATAPGQQLTTIDYAFTSRNLVVRNSSQAKLAQDVLEAEVSAEFAFLEGRMIQQFGYVEVPLELNLALVDNKLGLNLIGGLSSLFLIDNSVMLESDGNATEMGEANNLNTLNFSTNIGLGVEYEISPRIQLNLEPVFKYQLNTFSATAGSFNPYSIGVYSGINLRF